MWLQGSLPIFSPHVAISVVDNVLMVHQTDSQVVLLYDILTDPKGPISAPLPLLLRGAPSQSASSSQSTGKGSKRNLSSAELTMYGEGWVFINPDFVLDHMHGLLWRVRLDLEVCISFHVTIGRGVLVLDKIFYFKIENDLSFQLQFLALK